MKSCLIQTKVSTYPWIHELIKYRRRERSIRPIKGYTFRSLGVFIKFTFNNFSQKF